MIFFRAYTLFLFFLIFFLSPVYAAPLDPLAVDQAFSFNTEVNKTTGKVFLHWKIAPNYYLYQKKIQVSVLNSTLSPSSKKHITLSLPKASILPNSLLGDSFVYSDQLTLTLPPLQNSSILSIQYQGCAKAGFCYPPQTLTYHFEKKGPYFSLLPLIESHSLKTNTLENNTVKTKPITQLALFYLAGLLLAFTPCVLPMLPILASVIITEEKLSTLKGFLLSFSYVLSMASTYALAGILAVKMGQSVQLFFQNIWVMSLFSLFFVYLGLVQLEKLPLKLPTKLKDIFYRLHHKQQGGHILGAILLGILGTLISSPCVSAPLIATLSYISQTGNIFLGGSSLFIIGLGMGTPMILLGTLGGRFIPKAGRWMQLVNELFALLLFGLAIWIIRSILPPEIYLGLWGMWAIITGYFLGFFNKRKYRFLPIIGALIFIYGLILILGAAFGKNNSVHFFNPFHFFNAETTETSPLKFIRATELAGLNNVIKKHPKQIILIDFYADWCISCQQMDKNLFQDPAVVDLLKNMTLIKADITANGLAQDELLKAYQVFAPPSIYIINTNNPNQNLHFHGEIHNKEFISAVGKFLST